ncbi:RTX-I toxin determinant A from serotypes 1/9 [Marinomonas aquimarina]|uniref:RTX-I toxin determinant A from serotypes 1/9 n=1 Tax=Marinomonas aquimarina TaxID=295068 RepID=A0A1A8TH38_9GAMM|nr:DUF4347 domain-containing protein [Marinomonas aquimarina]SBS31353.1 RTX-I toxin determinant A from serotypes 1/9 [Marinomonas aquimarina]
MCTAYTQLIFIDPTVPDRNLLIKDLPKYIKPVFLDADNDAISQITAALSQYQNLDALHILTHGAPGQLIFSNSVLNAQTLGQYQAQLASWSQAMSTEADILLYGCETGKGDLGREFVLLLADMTNRPVQASSSLVGHRELGGTWELDFTSHSNARQHALSNAIMNDYLGLLSTSNEVYFIDASVPDSDTLIAGLDDNAEIVFIDSNEDGVLKMAEYLDGRKDIDGVHVISHGSNGAVYLGNSALNNTNLEQYQNALATIGSAMSEDGDILLYGCSIAEDENGLAFIQALADLTGADIAASDDITGISGDNELERSVGVIEQYSTGLAKAFESYQYDLATFTMNNSGSPYVETVSGVTMTVTAPSGVITGTNPNTTTLTSGNIVAVNSGASISFQFNSPVNVDSLIIDIRDGYSTSRIFTITPNTGVAVNSSSLSDSGDGEQISLGFTNIESFTITSSEVTVVDAYFDTIVFDVAPSGPTVTDGNISVTSTGSGTSGAYIVGDTITVRWNASLDGNTPADITTVAMDLSAFGGSSTESATQISSGIWQASYTVVEGAIDATNLNATVTATDTNGTASPVSDTSNLTVDSISPTVSDGNISISGASGTAGTYKIGDTVTATWDNTGTGDNNSDTISSVTVDFSAFGGGSAVTASNSSGTWTATYTIVAGSIDSTNLNVSVTATDNAGNQTTIADTTNASVDNEAPTSPSGSLDVDENSANSSSVGTVSAPGAITFTLTDSANGRFAIDNSGNVTVADTSQIDYESNTSHNIIVQATDDAGNTSSNTLAVTINNVNEVPTLTATGSNPTFTEDGSAESLFTGASASTADTGQTISGMVITVTNAADSGNEILNIDGSAITLDNAETGTSNNLSYAVAVSAGTATVTLSGGTLSAADVQTLIDGISYQNNSQTPSTSNRVVTITSLTDSGNDNNTASDLSVASTVTVSAVNDAPVIANLDATPSYTEDATAVQLDADISISDAELDALNGGSGNYAGSTLTIVRNGGVDSSDEFSISTGGNLTVSGSDISAGGHVIATFDTTSTAGQVTVSFQNNGTIPTQALVNEVLQAIHYRNTSNDPANSAQLNYTFNDGADTDTGSVTVTLTNVNDAPTITATGDNLTAAGAGSAVSVFSSTAIDAIESENIASVNFTVSGLTDTGNEKLIIDGSTVDLMTTVSSTNATGGNVAYAITNSSGTATVVITGPSAASAANTVFQTALNGMQYQNTLGSVTTGDRVFTITNVTDVGSGTNSWSDGNITSTIDVVNGDTPTAASNTYSGTEDTTVDLATAGMAATIETNASDVLDYITVTGITGGTLALTGSPSTTGAAGTVGMASVGTLSSDDKVSTANIGLIDFTPTTNSTTAASITYTVTDAGGDTSSTATLTINLAAVNDAPTAADATKSVSYNSTYTFQESDFSFSDVDTGDTLDHITIESLPAAGTLTFNGGALTLSDIPAEVTKAELVAGKLTFTPESGGTGAGYASFTFTVHDGTVDSASANTITMNVGSRPSSGSSSSATTTQIDGATVSTTTEQDNLGNTVEKVTVSATTSDREDTDSTSTGADLPFQFVGSNTNNVVTTLSLPTGLGAQILSNSTASTQNQVTNLVNLISNTGSNDDSLTAQTAGSSFLSSTSSSNTWVNSVTLTGSGSTGSSPVLITGTSDTTQREAVVIDTSSVSSGVHLQLDNIEFSYVVGSATITGGSGENYVHGDSRTQFIKLGADDDELHGGGGDDMIGSEGGDDILFGDSGDDIVFGGTGHDTLYGGTGNDVLQGGQTTQGTLAFSLNSAGEIVTSFSASDAWGDEVQPLTFSGDWYSQASMILDGNALGMDLSEDNIAVVMNAGLMLQATAEYSFLAMDSDRLQIIASSYQSIFGELSSASDLSGLAASNFSTAELANIAVQAWLSQQDEGFSTLPAEQQVSTLLGSFWLESDVTDAAISEVLVALSNGMSAGELFLVLAQSQQAKNKLTDDQGQLQITLSDELGETGLATEIGNDYLYGGAGDDTLIGGHGNDLLDGGEGTDTAVQQHLYAEYAIAQQSDGSITLTYQQGAYTEVDTLVGVEWVQFSDRLISTVDLL